MRFLIHYPYLRKRHMTVNLIVKSIEYRSVKVKGRMRLRMKVTDCICFCFDWNDCLDVLFSIVIVIMIVPTEALE